MKKYRLITIGLLISSGLFAQGIYNNGGKIVIGTGVTLTIGGPGGNYRNETNGSNGSMDLAGNLKIGGNLTNNVAGADLFTSTATGSEVILASTALQTLDGSTAATFNFDNLTVDNSVGVIMAKNAQVNGKLTLTNGLIEIGNNNFTFGPTSSVLGTPSATNMIIATGVGQVQKYWTGTGTFTFPIGNFSLSSKYTPVSLNFTSGAFAAGAIVGVNLVTSKYNDPSITGSYLNRYWNITQTGITGFVCNAMYQYTLADVVGTEASIAGLQVLPAPIKAFTGANVTTHQLNTNGLTSFGTFTGGPGNNSLMLTAFLEGPFNGTNGMTTLLNTGNLIPKAQPYTNVAPWNYTGTESVTAVPAGVVDWVFVEVRQAASAALATSATILTKRAGFLTSTGAIVDLDGVSPLNLGRFANTANLYVVIRHRNHLAIMSAAGATLTNQTYNYDFTTSLTQAYGGGSGYKQVGTTFAMVAGDITQDGNIFVTDYNAWAIGFGSTAGYYGLDLNMDGNVFVTDYNTWAVNFGSTIVPGLKSAQTRSKYFSAVPQ